MYEYDHKIKGNLEKISPHKLEQLISDYKQNLLPTSERQFNQIVAAMRLNAVHAGLLMQKHPDVLVNGRARKALGDLVVNSGRISEFGDIIEQNMKNERNTKPQN